MKIQTILKGLLVYLLISLIVSPAPPPSCCGSQAWNYDYEGCTDTCGNSGRKWVICHRPPGNIGNCQELCLPTSGAANHIENHCDDNYGPCGEC